ncbi:MAG: type II toxin-antitoxin system RelE family toxin [Rhodoplanes sp.]|jgi:mRNA interferase RelE/StbE
MLVLRYRKSAMKDMRRLPEDVAQTIHQKLGVIAANPWHHGSDVKKLKGHPAFRLRVGNWRAIFEIHDGEVLEVVRVTSRGGAYKS